jgi:hypothetical protein
LLGWLPLGLRLLVGMVMLAQFAGWLTEPPPFLAVRTPLGSSQTHFHLMLTFYALGGLSTVLGVIGRGGAALLLLGVGLQQGILPLGWQGRMILIAACGLFFLGSGLAAIWQPEEQLIRRRWGERRDVSAS